MQKRGPYRSKRFLAWAKSQTSHCCVCRDGAGAQLHHFGPKGMGQKASDLLVARVCAECHLGKNAIQGKRRIAFERIDRLDVWCDINEDCIGLLSSYVEYLESLLDI